MANVKISNLTAATTPVAGTEVLPIVQSGATVKVSIANLTPGLSTITTAKGGTGLTSFTSGGVVYASSTSALTTGSALVFDGTNLAVGVATPTSYFSSADNLVVGTTSGNNGATILGSSTGTATLAFGIGTGTSAGDGSNRAKIYYDGTSDTLRMSNGGALMSATQFVLDASGNLGLGVTPSAWSSTYDAVQVGSRGAFWANTSGGDIYLSNNYYFDGAQKYIATGFASFYSQTSGEHRWNIAPSGTAGNAITFTQAMTLDASGNLLVGTTSNTLLADSGGFIVYPTSTGETYYAVKHDTGTSSGATYAAFTYATSIIGSITQNGTTGVLYNIISDYRLKTVVGAVTGQGERIDALEPIEYEWKANGLRTRGFLAHKFQEVYANSVTGTKDDVDADGNAKYQQMQAATSEVIADLVAEIQSLRKRLAALESA